ncbi:MAG: hypothetical protein U0325_07630 [Polyangiales bacterium]
MNANADALREALDKGLRATLDEVIPWFHAQMPAAYFADTSERERVAHIMAVATARMAWPAPRLTLRSEDGARWTFISDLDKPGMLGDILDAAAARRGAAAREGAHLGRRAPVGRHGGARRGAALR